MKNRIEWKCTFVLKRLVATRCLLTPTPKHLVATKHLIPFAPKRLVVAQMFGIIHTKTHGGCQVFGIVHIFLHQVSNRHYLGYKLCEDLQPFKGIK
jgi:hypothetical protein